MQCLPALLVVVCSLRLGLTYTWLQGVYQSWDIPACLLQLLRQPLVDLQALRLLLLQSISSQFSPHLLQPKLLLLGLLLQCLT